MFLQVAVMGSIDEGLVETTRYLVECPIQAVGHNHQEFLNNLLAPTLKGRKYTFVEKFGIMGVFIADKAKSMEVDFDVFTPDTGDKQDSRIMEKRNRIEDNFLLMAQEEEFQKLKEIQP